MPVYVSLDGLPSSASLRMTGSLPGFVGSKSPEVAAIVTSDHVVVGVEQRGSGGEADGAIMECPGGGMERGVRKSGMDVCC
jgi:hypothetical protein